MTRTGRRIAWVVVVSLAASAAGQGPIAPAPEREGAKPQSPKSDPVDDSIEKVRALEQGRPAPPRAFAPAIPDRDPAPTPRRAEPMVSMPEVMAEDPTLPRRRFYPEGTFFAKRAGSLFRASTGEVIFIPRRDALARGDAPMVLLPCRTLERLESAPGVFQASTVVTLSGQAFVYKDRQFLLPSVYSVSAGESPAGPDLPAPAAPEAPASPPTDRDPAVADLIRDLEAARAAPRAVEAAPARASTPAAESDPKPAKGHIPEGELVFNRRGRLSRTPDGSLAVWFDGDHDSPPPAPLVLLRCRMTQRLEEMASARGEGLVVTVSGRVTAQGGRSYLLPTLAQVVAPGDVKPMQ